MRILRSCFRELTIRYLSNIFVLGYRRGFYFTSSVGPSSSLPSTYGFTSRFLMNNCGVDFSAQGIHIDGAGTSGMVSNFYCLGGPRGINGIHVAASALLQCSNIRATAYGTNAIRDGRRWHRLFLSKNYFSRELGMIIQVA